MEFTVLYTHQKTKKSKKWQDGKLCITSSGGIELFRDDDKKVESVYCKADQIKVGEQIESDRHLITIEAYHKPPDHQRNESTSESNQGRQFHRNKPSRKKWTGFTVPRPASQQPHSKESFVHQNINILADQTNVLNTPQASKEISNSSPTLQNDLSHRTQFFSLYRQTQSESQRTPNPSLQDKIARADNKKDNLQNDSSPQSSVSGSSHTSGKRSASQILALLGKRKTSFQPPLKKTKLDSDAEISCPFPGNQTLSLSGSNECNSSTTIPQHGLVHINQMDIDDVVVDREQLLSPMGRLHNPLSAAVKQGMCDESLHDSDSHDAGRMILSDDPQQISSTKQVVLNQQVMSEVGCPVKKCLLHQTEVSLPAVTQEAHCGEVGNLITEEGDDCRVIADRRRLAVEESDRKPHTRMDHGTEGKLPCSAGSWNSADSSQMDEQPILQGICEDRMPIECVPSNANLQSPDELSGKESLIGTNCGTDEIVSGLKGHDNCGVLEANQQLAHHDICDDTKIACAPLTKDEQENQCGVYFEVERNQHTHTGIDADDHSPISSDLDKDNIDTYCVDRKKQDWDPSIRLENQDEKKQISFPSTKAKYSTVDGNDPNHDSNISVMGKEGHISTDLVKSSTDEDANGQSENLEALQQTCVGMIPEKAYTEKLAVGKQTLIETEQLMKDTRDGSAEDNKDRPKKGCQMQSHSLWSHAEENLEPSTVDTGHEFLEEGRQLRHINPLAAMEVRVRAGNNNNYGKTKNVQTFEQTDDMTELFSQPCSQSEENFRSQRQVQVDDNRARCEEERLSQFIEACWQSSSPESTEEASVGKKRKDVMNSDDISAQNGLTASKNGNENLQERSNSNMSTRQKTLSEPSLHHVDGCMVTEHGSDMAESDFAQKDAAHRGIVEGDLDTTVNNQSDGTAKKSFCDEFHKDSEKNLGETEIDCHDLDDDENDNSGDSIVRDTSIPKNYDQTCSTATNCLPSDKVDPGDLDVIECDIIDNTAEDVSVPVNCDQTDSITINSFGKTRRNQGSSDVVCSGIDYDDNEGVIKGVMDASVDLVIDKTTCCVTEQCREAVGSQCDTVMVAPGTVKGSYEGSKSTETGKDCSESGNGYCRTLVSNKREMAVEGHSEVLAVSQSNHEMSTGKPSIQSEVYLVANAQTGDVKETPPLTHSDQGDIKTTPKSEDGNMKDASSLPSEPVVDITSDCTSSESQSLSATSVDTMDLSLPSSHQDTRRDATCHTFNCLQRDSAAKLPTDSEPLTDNTDGNKCLLTGVGKHSEVSGDTIFQFETDNESDGVKTCGPEHFCNTTEIKCSLGPEQSSAAKERVSQNGDVIKTSCLITCTPTPAAGFCNSNTMMTRKLPDVKDRFTLSTPSGRECHTPMDVGEDTKFVNGIASRMTHTGASFVVADKSRSGDETVTKISEELAGEICQTPHRERFGLMQRGLFCDDDRKVGMRHHNGGTEDTRTEISHGSKQMLEVLDHLPTNYTEGSYGGLATLGDSDQRHGHLGSNYMEGLSSSSSSRTHTTLNLDAHLHGKSNRATHYWQKPLTSNLVSRRASSATVTYASITRERDYHRMLPDYVNSPYSQNIPVKREENLQSMMPDYACSFQGHQMPVAVTSDQPLQEYLPSYLDLVQTIDSPAANMRTYQPPQSYGATPDKNLLSLSLPFPDTSIMPEQSFLAEGEQPISAIPSSSILEDNTRRNPSPTLPLGSNLDGNPSATCEFSGYTNPKSVLSEYLTEAVRYSWLSSTVDEAPYINSQYIMRALPRIPNSDNTAEMFVAHQCPSVHTCSQASVSQTLDNSAVLPLYHDMFEVFQTPSMLLSNQPLHSSKHNEHNAPVSAQPHPSNIQFETCGSDHWIQNHLSEQDHPLNRSSSKLGIQDWLSPSNPSTYCVPSSSQELTSPARSSVEFFQQDEKCSPDISIFSPQCVPSSSQLSRTSVEPEVNKMPDNQGLDPLQVGHARSKEQGGTEQSVPDDSDVASVASRGEDDSQVDLFQSQLEDVNVSPVREVMSSQATWRDKLIFTPLISIATEDHPASQAKVQGETEQSVTDDSDVAFVTSKGEDNSQVDLFPSQMENISISPVREMMSSQAAWRDKILFTPLISIATKDYPISQMFEPHGIADHGKTKKLESVKEQTSDFIGVHLRHCDTESLPEYCEKQDAASTEDSSGDLTNMKNETLQHCERKAPLHRLGPSDLSARNLSWDKRSIPLNRSSQATSDQTRVEHTVCHTEVQQSTVDRNIQFVHGSEQKVPLNNIPSIERTVSSDHNMPCIDKSALSEQTPRRRVHKPDRPNRGTKGRSFQTPVVDKLVHEVHGKNICSDLIFPSIRDISSATVPQREVQIPVSFPDATAYKQTLTAVLNEHVNIILYEVAYNFFSALSKVDVSSYSPFNTHGGNEGNPPCQHRMASKKICVKKDGPNKGRFFYTCGKPRGSQCKFFQWADQGTTNAKSQLSSKEVLSDSSSIEMYLKSFGVSIYCECQLLRKSPFSDSLPGAPAWIKKYRQSQINNDRKKLYLKLSRKEVSSLYGKDDLWVISRDLSFGSSDTFLAKSVFHGPNGVSELEIQPITGYSPSNWSSQGTVHAIHAYNASTELCCLSNLQEFVKPQTLPLLPALLTRDSSSLVISQHLQPAFKSPALTTSNLKELCCSNQQIVELANTVISKYLLNEDQAKALQHMADMFVHKTANDQSSPITLIHDFVVMPRIGVLYHGQHDQGVFGAGKSYLLAVTVLFLTQLFHLHEENGGNPTEWKVLISSTTNVAVDRILLSLLELGFEEFIRVGSMRKIAKPVLPFSVHASDKDNAELKELQEMLRGNLSVREKNFVRKSIERQRLGINKQMLSKVLAVGVTCAACSFPCINNLKFPVVLLDECSQITEPASLLPVARFECNKLVLVGDPHQLDPTIQGSEASNPCSLEQTLFDRLLLMGHKPILLRTQYRCHPEISAIANDLFYDNKLLDGITREERNRLADGFPTVCFYSVANGRECRTTGGSFLNDKEAEFVITMIEVLMLKGVEPSQIGVITLYKAQVAHITTLIQQSRFAGMKELKAIQISTVDAFQGGEKDIIILSCVRSDFMGFAASDKRTNVALTRSRNHLLIVGNQKILAANSLWCRVLAKCKEGIQDSSILLKEWTVALEEEKMKGKIKKTKRRAATSVVSSSPPLSLESCKGDDDVSSEAPAQVSSMQTTEEKSKNVRVAQETSMPLCENKQKNGTCTNVDSGLLMAATVGSELRHEASATYSPPISLTTTIAGTDSGWLIKDDECQPDQEDRDISPSYSPLKDLPSSDDELHSFSLDF